MYDRDPLPWPLLSVNAVFKWYSGDGKYRINATNNNELISYKVLMLRERCIYGEKKKRNYLYNEVMGLYRCFALIVTIRYACAYLAVNMSVIRNIWVPYQNQSCME